MDHCKEFARYLVEEKHVSDNTLDSYRRDTEHFLSFLSSVRNVDPLSVKVEDIKAYVEYLHDSTRAFPRLPEVLRLFAAFSNI